MRIKDIENAIDHLNNELSTPANPWSQVEGGQKANVGNFHLSQAYGGYSLHQMSNTSGASHDVFRCSYIPKRELHGMIQAMITGIDASAPLLLAHRTMNIAAYQEDQAKRIAADPNHVPATGPLPYTWVEPQPKEMF
jgi:hypothetical protein|tara:strand:+ start:82 stop:492 length:411 start_codon:yes stop_codon:yes gene_type:complete